MADDGRTVFCESGARAEERVGRPARLAASVPTLDPLAGADLAFSCEASVMCEVGTVVSCGIVEDGRGEEELVSSGAARSARLRLVPTGGVMASVRKDAKGKGI